MKKIIAFLLLGTMMFSLCACGETQPDVFVENPVPGGVGDVSTESTTNKEQTETNKTDEQTDKEDTSKEGTSKEEVNNEYADEEYTDEECLDNIVSDVSDEFIGKTLGDLEKGGWKRFLYAGFEFTEIYTYEKDATLIRIKVDITDEFEEKMDEIDFMDPDKKQKEADLISTLVIVDIESAIKKISNEELNSYVGKTASALINDGFTLCGFVGISGTYKFYFEKNHQSFAVTLENAASDYMKNNHTTGDEQYQTDILNYKIEKIAFGK